MATVLNRSDDPLVNDEEWFYEVVDGVRVEKPPMGAFENVLASTLITVLNEFARPQRLGIAAGEVVFIIDSARDLRRRPDVAFVAYPRWPTKRIPRESAWNVVPNLAVEIISPTNLAEDVEKKAFEYLECGVELVWVIYPETERIHVFRPSAASVLVVDARGALDGEGILPGFRLPVRELFDALTRPDLDEGEN